MARELLLLQSSKISPTPLLFDSVFFSILDTPQNATVTFTDPYAKQLNVACTSIPQAGNDTYNITWVGPGAYLSAQQNSKRMLITFLGEQAEDELFGSLGFTFQVVINPRDGIELVYSHSPYLEMINGAFQLGGEKPTEDSLPSFWRRSKLQFQGQPINLIVPQFPTFSRFCLVVLLPPTTL